MSKQRRVSSKKSEQQKVHDQTQYASPSWHGKELAATERRVKNGRKRFVDWDEAKRQLRKSGN